MRNDRIRALHRAIVDLIRIYHFRDREAVCCFDVSVTQSHMLERIVSVGPLTIGELAGALYLERSTVSRIVDGLEEKGYARRTRDSKDGRIVRISATARGTRLAEKIEAEMLRQEESVFAEFNEEELNTIAQGIERMTKAASGRVQTSGGACRWES